jgi:hypothetical protein
MPTERFPEGTFITGYAIHGVRAMACKGAIGFYLKNRMKLNRSYTPANMRAVASEFTGKTYARSRKGLENAYKDLEALILSKNSLDELGETRRVNREVGGVAADLSHEDR